MCSSHRSRPPVALVSAPAHGTIRPGSRREDRVHRLERVTPYHVRTGGIGPGRHMASDVPYELPGHEAPLTARRTNTLSPAPQLRGRVGSRAVA